METSFWCDREMIPIIRTLNKKGYVTIACCSGHENGDFCYILFSYYVLFELLERCPKGFELEESKCGVTLTATKNGFLHENIDTLMGWAESLPFTMDAVGGF